MQTQSKNMATGHVRLVSRTRGDVWYLRARRPDGSQVNRKLGPAWPKKGRPPEGYFTKSTAEQALVKVLAELNEQARKPAPATVTFAEAATEWLRYSEHDREVRASTLVDYVATARKVIDAFGDTPLTEITPQDVEAYKQQLLEQKKRPSARTVNRHLTVLGGIFRRAGAKWGINHNPVLSVKKQRERSSGDLNFLRPEEVHALVRAAANEQDAALYLAAALTGLRQGELLALRWGDVDFGLQRLHVRRSWSWVAGEALIPKSGKVRSVPMADEVIAALDGLSRRERFTGQDDLVFPAWDGTVDRHEDVRGRFKAALAAAALKPIRFHDLRHTFGTLAAQKLPLTTVQALMGHADISTTMIYSHYVPAPDEAAKIGEAFRVGASVTPALDPIAA
jgi:integrase